MKAPPATTAPETPALEENRSPPIEWLGASTVAAASPQDFAVGPAPAPAEEETPSADDRAPLFGERDDRAAEKTVKLHNVTGRPPLTPEQQRIFASLPAAIERGEAALRRVLLSLTTEDAEAICTANDPELAPPILYLISIQVPDQPAMLDLLLDICPTAVTGRNLRGRTALHAAARRADPWTLARVLRHAGDVDAQDDDGDYPLYELTRQAGDRDSATLRQCAALLIDAGADWTPVVNGRDAAGACASDRQLCNLVMGLPAYTASLQETLRENRRLTPTDVRRLRASGRPLTRGDLIDRERAARGAPPLYLNDPDNKQARRRCLAMLDKRSR
ncbi:hypothetical protein GN316_14165 [Xylophilus sp. Kf1]|nr:hypothetical protein [Xylophilus sp. Kf1]